MKRKGRKIAILGTAPSWRDAPFHDLEWEIWVCNRAGLKQKPWHRLFEIHKNWDYEGPFARDKYLGDLKSIKPPQQVVSVVPIGGKANVVIDRDALFKKYGSIWFSSSFGYMVACALEENPTDLGFWGIDMESREEYVVQFGGLRHFIDLAKFAGVKIHIPERSCLLREPLAYPDRFETTLALTLESKAARIKKLIVQSEEAVETYKADVYRGEGRRKTMREYGADVEDIESELQKDRVMLRRLEAGLNKLHGELMATQHYKRLFVWNVLPPDLGEETSTDIQDCGPI